MIYWDMDGVLANFNKGAKQLIKDANLPIPDEDDYHYLSNPLYKEQVQHIATSGCFWRNLEVIPEGIEGFNLARNYSMVLSSPQFFASATPKFEWCHKHLGIKDDKVILTSAKHHLAAKDRFLIDDKSTNCQEFAEAGGRAVLVELPYSYKDAKLTRKTLHPNIIVTETKYLPKLIKGILDIYYD